jgi:carbohydrate-selective porin OprB
MKISRVLAAAAAASIVLGLTACAATPAVAPITVEVGDLQGETVQVPLNSMLNINTGDLDVDSYTAEIADTSIAEFVEGRDDGSATFNPGLKPLKVGETEVVLKNEDGGIQNVTFTLEVVPVPAGSNLGGSGR